MSDDLAFIEIGFAHIQHFILTNPDCRPVFARIIERATIYLEEAYLN